MLFGRCDAFGSSAMHLVRVVDNIPSLDREVVVRHLPHQLGSSHHASRTSEKQHALDFPFPDASHPFRSMALY